MQSASLYRIYLSNFTIKKEKEEEEVKNTQKVLSTRFTCANKFIKDRQLVKTNKIC
jgi:hypothetical protein